MRAKSFMRAGLTATFALISLASIPKHLSAEALSATNTVAAPIEGVSYGIGSKSMHGYFVRENGACSVILMIAEKIDPETASPVSAARVRLMLQPGEVAGLDSEEGRSLNFTCGGRAATLLVNEGETKALIAQQKREALAAANFQLNALAFAQPHSLGDALITEWLTCTHEATDRLSEGSNEPAEMIVIKVFDACSQIDEAYYLDLQHRLKLSVAKADNVKAGLRSIAHKRIIAEVVALRAKIKPQEQ